MKNGRQSDRILYKFCSSCTIVTLQTFSGNIIHIPFFTSGPPFPSFPLPCPEKPIGGHKQSGAAVKRSSSARNQGKRGKAYSFTPPTATPAMMNFERHR